MIMGERARSIAAKLNRSKELKATVGFDGYIDELVRVVQQGDSQSGYTYFPSISAFADRLQEAAGKSTDLETVTTDIKLGGNAPIMSNALACLGVDTTCIGAMGCPELRDVFREMATRCHCISLCEPAYTHALEFGDGKVMMANCKPLENLNWKNLKAFMGLDAIVSLFDNCQLIAMVNWSGIVGAGDIWDGISREVLPLLQNKHRFFFDLCDPSKKSREDILSVLEKIQKFKAYGSVVLGMNENEALRVAGAMGASITVAEEAGKVIYSALPIDAVVVHPIDRCIAVTENGTVVQPGRVVENPRISTGGGDNFNAGFCLGQMLELDIADSMLLGIAVSGCYVQNGSSPDRKQIIDYLDSF